jgi:DNA-binding response OmpR family regulator
VDVPAEKRIIVATDGSEMWSIIEEVLTAGGFAPRRVENGEEALGLIEEWKPSSAVLDVSLPGTPVFEICDRVRNNAALGSMGLILLASVYEQTRYKRAPTSLYGADDYIEKHHLRDSLVPKIERLQKGTGEAVPAAHAPPPPAEREEARAHREPDIDPRRAVKEQDVIVREERFGPAEEEASPRDESLRRFARIIVSDIALYNQELIEDGVRKGNLRELLADDIAEGMKLFRARAREEGAMQLYEEALDEFIRQQQSRFSGSR